MSLRFTRNPSNAPNFQHGGRPIPYGNGTQSPVPASPGPRGLGLPPRMTVGTQGSSSPVPHGHVAGIGRVSSPSHMDGTRARPTPVIRSQFGGKLSAGAVEPAQVRARPATASALGPSTPVGRHTVDAPPAFRPAGATSSATSAQPSGTHPRVAQGRSGSVVQHQHVGQARAGPPRGSTAVSVPASPNRASSRPRTAGATASPIRHASPIRQRSAPRAQPQPQPQRTAIGGTAGTLQRRSRSPQRQTRQQPAVQAQQRRQPVRGMHAVAQQGSASAAASNVRDQPPVPRAGTSAAPGAAYSAPAAGVSGARSTQHRKSPVDFVRQVTREHSHRHTSDHRPVRRFSEEGGRGSDGVVVRRESSFGRNGVHSLPRPVRSYNSTPTILEDDESPPPFVNSAPGGDPTWVPQQHRPHDGRQPVEHFEHGGTDLYQQKDPAYSKQQKQQQPSYYQQSQPKQTAKNQPRQQPAQSYYDQQQTAQQQQQQPPQAKRPTHRPREENVSRHLSRCPIPPSPGRFDLHYRVLSRLGEGAFADVMKAQNLETGEEVAVKIIQKTRWKNQPAILGSLFQELEVLHSVNHGNIVQFFEYFETRDTLYIVMELVGGGDLLDHIEGKPPMRETDAAEVVKQVCKALVFLHKKGIVHRDLKPENILLTQKASCKKIKLCDFGQAVFHSSTTDFEIFGTPEYCAPEVLRHVLTHIRKPSLDMWSLGVVAFVLCSGVFPYPGTTEQQMARSIMTGNRVKRNFSRALDDFLNQVLQLDPEKRPTASEALDHPWLQGAAPPRQARGPQRQAAPQQQKQQQQQQQSRQQYQQVQQQVQPQYKTGVAKQYTNKYGASTAAPTAGYGATTNASKTVVTGGAGASGVRYTQKQQVRTTMGYR